MVVFKDAICVLKELNIFNIYKSKHLEIVYTKSFEFAYIAKRLLFLPEQVVRAKEKQSLMRMH